MESSEHQNPTTPSMWWERATTVNPNPAHLDILAYEAQSASNFDETDFIHLKALWRNKPANQLHINDYVRSEYVRNAEEDIGWEPSPVSEPRFSFCQNMIAFINTAAAQFQASDPDSAQFGAFLLPKMLLERMKYVNNKGQAIEETTKIFRRLGRLNKRTKANPAAEQVPWDEQPRIGLTIGRPTTTETVEPEKVWSGDDGVVGYALHQLLSSIILCSGIGYLEGRGRLGWVAAQQPFPLGPATNIVYEAQVDGLLRNLEHLECSGPLAILEVKAYMRHLNQLSIEWQEACQMTAWISSALKEQTAEKRRAGLLTTSASDGTTRRRLLISQNYLALYITVGEWGEGYENYANGERRSTPSDNSSPTPQDLEEGNFLVMNCYGPYSVGDQEHMGLFIRNVLALIMELSDPQGARG